MSRAESEKLLGELYAHITQPAFVYGHSWRVGDLLMWDNIGTVHYAVADYTMDEARYMRRLQVMATLLPMALGFVLQSVFLYLRGQAHGRCPLTNLFEAFIFIGWCIVLLYFLVGTAYRLSLLGVFTAPLVSSLQIFQQLPVVSRQKFLSQGQTMSIFTGHQRDCLGKIRCCSICILILQ